MWSCAQLTGIQNGANQWALLADAILSGLANCTHFSFVVVLFIVQLLAQFNGTGFAVSFFFFYICIFVIYTRTA